MTSKAWGYSIILHVMLFLLIYFGLPSLMKDKVLEDNVVMVEILPVSEITNVKVAKLKPKVEPKKDVKLDPTPSKPSKPEPEKPKPVETPKPLPPEVKPEPVKPEPVKPVEKPVEKQKEVKKEEKKPEPKKPEKKQEDHSLDSILKNLEKPQAEEKKEEPKKGDNADFDKMADALSKTETETEYKPNVPVSASVKDAIRKQVSDNWSITSGAKDAKDMVVTLTISMGQDGTVTDVKIGNQMRYNTDAPYRAMVDSAVRAVHKASPMKGLPADTYQGGWDQIEMNFDPSEML